MGWLFSLATRGRRGFGSSSKARAVRSFSATARPGSDLSRRRQFLEHDMRFPFAFTAAMAVLAASWPAAAHHSHANYEAIKKDTFPWPPK